MASGVRIAAVGDVVLDQYLPAAEAEGRLGGISVNFARCARLAGAHVELYGAIGTDDRARRLAGELALAGLDAHVRSIPGPSALQKIRLAPDGERIFCGFDPGILAGYRLSAAELGELSSFDVVALTCSAELGQVFDQVVQADLGARALKVADFSQESPGGDPDRPETWVRPHLDRLAVAFVGGRPDFLEPLRLLSESTDTVLVLTVGAAGAHALHRGRALHQPSVARTIVDTTGCGDAFQGAFTATYFGGGSLEQALAAGADCAAVVAGRIGAAPTV